MKIILFLLLAGNFAFAKTRYFKCHFSGKVRQSGVQHEEGHTANMKLDFDVDIEEEKVSMTQVYGFISLSYYGETAPQLWGVFEDNEKVFQLSPYERRSAYSETHYRFKDINTVHEFGNEWFYGTLLVPKAAVHVANELSEIEVVYSNFRTESDHFGGSLNLKCSVSNSYYSW